MQYSMLYEEMESFKSATGWPEKRAARAVERVGAGRACARWRLRPALPRQQQRRRIRHLEQPFFQSNAAKQARRQSCASSAARLCRARHVSRPARGSPIATRSLRSRDYSRRPRGWRRIRWRRRRRVARRQVEQRGRPGECCGCAAHHPPSAEGGRRTGQGDEALADGGGRDGGEARCRAQPEPRRGESASRAKLARCGCLLDFEEATQAQAKVQELQARRSLHDQRVALRRAAGTQDARLLPGGGNWPIDSTREHATAEPGCASGSPRCRQQEDAGTATPARWRRNGARGAAGGAHGCDD